MLTELQKRNKLKKKLKEEYKRIDLLRVENTNKFNEIQALKYQLSAVNSAITTVNDRCRTVESENVGLKGQVDSLNDIITRGRDHNDLLMRRVDEHLIDILGLKDQLAKLHDDSTATINEANEELQRLSATLDDVEEQNRSLQVKLNQEKETKLAITSALKSVTLTL